MGEVNPEDSARSANGPGAAGSEAESAQTPTESSTFLRCTQCAKAEAIDRSGGTLVCGEYNMRVNAEADEIPDDCVGFSPVVADNPAE